MLLAVGLFQAVLCPLTLVSAATNFSIDDQNPLFVYTPMSDWTRITGSLDANDGHMMTMSPTAYANITYTFASVYYVSAKWPYDVTTNYGIDGNPPITYDMQDHSIPDTGGGTATISYAVIGQWIGTTNQEHTIHITVPPGGKFAIVDMFIFEVLDVNTSSVSSSTSTGSITVTSTGSPSFSSSSSVSPSISSSGSHGISTQVRNLAISMAIVGTSLVLLLYFLLWRFCIRRKKQDPNPITPHYDPLPTGRIIRQFDGDGRSPRRESLFDARYDTSVPLNDNSASFMRYGDGASRYGGIQNDSNNFQKPSNYSFDHSPHNSRTMNQPASSLLPRQASLLRTHHDGRISTPSMTSSDRPSSYTRDIPTPNSAIPLIGRNDANSILDGSTSASSSSGNGNNNEKRSTRNVRSFSRILPNALLTGKRDSVMSTEIQEMNEETDGAGDGGYP